MLVVSADTNDAGMPDALAISKASIDELHLIVI
jgi:hypothetical protein